MVSRLLWPQSQLYSRFKLIAGAMADAVLEGKQGNQEAAPAEDAANA